MARSSCHLFQKLTKEAHRSRTGGSLLTDFFGKLEQFPVREFDSLFVHDVTGLLQPIVLGSFKVVFWTFLSFAGWRVLKSHLLIIIIIIIRIWCLKMIKAVTSRNW